MTHRPNAITHVLPGEVRYTFIIFRLFTKPNLSPDTKFWRRHCVRPRLGGHKMTPIESIQKNKNILWWSDPWYKQDCMPAQIKFVITQLVLMLDYLHCRHQTAGSSHSTSRARRACSDMSMRPVEPNSANFFIRAHTTTAASITHAGHP